MTHRTFARRIGRRGSIFLAVLIIMILAATGVVLSTAATTYELRQARRSYDRQQAYYAAEAGVQRVVHWYNNPASAPASLAVRSGGNVPAAASTWAASSSDLETSFTLRMKHSGRTIAKVVELEVGPPPGGVAAGKATVKATGETLTGVRATIEVVLKAPSSTPLIIPAALMTEGLVTTGGNFQVHWGEIWAQGDVEAPVQWKDWPLTIPGSTAYVEPSGPAPGQDPWFQVKSEGYLRSSNGTNYIDGRIDGLSTATAPALPGGDYSTTSDWDNEPSTPDELHMSGHPYYQPFINFDGIDPTIPHLHANNYGGHPDHEFRENIYTNQTLDWPDLTYDTMKNYVLDNGLAYYRLTNDGDVVDENGVARDFYYMFSRATSLSPGDTRDGIEPTDPDDISRDQAAPVIFVDTPDGRSPAEWAADGLSLPEVQISGNDNFYYGMFFIAGDVTVNGAGNEEDFDAPEMPDGSIYGDPIAISWYGLLLSYGLLTTSGNPSAYGAVYAAEGYDGSGTWSIHYDVRLRDPTRQQPSGRVTIAMWDTY